MLKISSGETSQLTATLESMAIDKSEGRTPPLEQAEFERRIERVRGFLREEGLEGLLIYGNASFHSDFIRYLANYVHAYTPAQSFLMLSLSKGPILLIDEPWQIPSALEMSPVTDIRPIRSRGTSEEVVAALGGALKDLGIASGQLGISSRSLPYFFANELRDAFGSRNLVDADPIWWRVVATPTEFDQQAIRHTAHVASEGMKVVAGACKVGITEQDAAMAGLAHMGALGAEFLHGSGPCTHVNFGSFSKLPSNVRPSNYTARSFEPGMLFWVDMTCTVNGYYTDMDRTMGVSPVPTEKLRMYDAVRRMYDQMIDVMRPGIAGKEVYVAAMRVAEEENLAGYVNQVPLGHTTGICTGVRPMLTATEEMQLAADSFVNIEPGIHMAGVGSACIEDTIFVGRDGVEAINTASIDPYLN